MAEPSATVTLIIEGTKSKIPARTLPTELEQFIRTTRPPAAYDLETPLRGAAAPEIVVEARDDDLMELQLEGGSKLLMTVADYRAQFGDKTSRGPEDAGRLRIRATLPGRSRDRGFIQ